MSNIEYPGIIQDKGRVARLLKY